jgi:hypothetical protein
MKSNRILILLISSFNFCCIFVFSILLLVICSFFMSKISCQQLVLTIILLVIHSMVVFNSIACTRILTLSLLFTTCCINVMLINYVILVKVGTMFT